MVGATSRGAPNSSPSLSSAKVYFGSPVITRGTGLVVCAVRVSCLLVDRLLGVAVINNDQQDVSGLLASFVDRDDDPVSRGNGPDRVADLIQIW